ncbi:MAG TPA: SurA N-terminal domain-containing protein [Smithella sp.]|nr:SurA N-terminal domain-containing protein [Smithella sp.]
MLKFFRKHARGWFMIGILGIIIIVFVLYFGSNRGGQNAKIIATIDKKAISEAEFHNEYERMLDMARIRLGAKLTPEILKKMDLKKKTYDELLNKQIILAKAADLKIQVSDDELRNSIMSLPELQTNGEFDERRYQQILRYNRMTSEDFETLHRANMIANKIESLVREGVKISDQEVHDLYMLQNQKINVNFVQISGNDIKKKFTPTESELEDYLKHNSNLFRVPEQIKIQYIFFSGDSFPQDVSDADIKSYYLSNKDKYKTRDGKQQTLTEAQGSIARELKRTRGLPNAYSEARKARDVIYQEDNMEAYASKNNLKIHNLDFFSINKTPQELESLKNLTETLLDMQKNEISKVIAAEDGYYLFKIVDIKPAYSPKLSAIENEVRRRFTESETQTLAEKEAQSIIERLKTGEGLDKIAKEKGLKVNETGFFKTGDTIPKVGTIPDASDVLFQLSASKPYAEKPLFINNAYFILKLKDVSKPDEKDFEAQKAMYTKILLSMKRDEALQTWLEGNKAAMIKEKRVKIKKTVETL